ncbi:hypothetical protein HZS55_13030 [Halosimplex rubrum]|uniref:Uncharacterized protein n=1 Tax=Halosimplex rubrum TaxID=869889 RepID=A0A7D5TMA3_9EURY|nr:hypothetical protein [Halosimplex rubrum]QLH78172.1 hypothetical protein HZS55_13030 [Halosimplex rubrum]
MTDDSDTPDPSATDGEETDEDESTENNRTRVKLQSHGLEVEVESQDASFDEVAEFASDQHQKIRRDALIGEYQQLEERNLHSALLGGDR